jgi:hypothetical protein
LSYLAAKALAEQLGDIGLVVDDENAEAHAALVAAPDSDGRRDCFASLAMTTTLLSLRGAERRSNLVEAVILPFGLS